MYRNNFLDGNNYQALGPFGHMGSWGPDGWMLVALAVATPFILALVLWSIVWKGLALWHSARRGQYWWFVILVVVNTLGILDIVYLFFVAKIKFKDLFTANSGHAGHTSHQHNAHHNHS